MSHRRPQDLTRFKKTYSYSRQEPVLSDEVARTIDLANRDLTRFRKTYSSSRQRPVNPDRVAAIIAPVVPPVTNFILTEASDALTTEAGDNLVLE